MVRDYIKKIYPGTWKHTYYTPPITYTVTVDTSSPWITNTISPITVGDSSTATYNSSLSTRVVLTDPATNVDVTPIDEFTTISGWSIDMGGTTTSMVSQTSYPITDDAELVPTVSHLVIHKDTQGPCPDGYHIGTQSERNVVVATLDNLGVKNETDTMTYLKLPANYYLNRSNGSLNQSYGMVRLWTSTMSNNTTTPAFIVDETHTVQVKNDKPGNAFGIRPFKDSAVQLAMEDIDIYGGEWTSLYYSGGSPMGPEGIFWHASKGLITMFSYIQGVRLTMKDRNLGATNILDVGLYYQFGNNYGFTVSPSTYYTTKVSNTQGYGPGNYYYDEHFIRASSGNGWFTDTNNNIWGGVTNGTWTDPV